MERSSDGVRAERGVKSGLHVWEVLWNPNHRGSHAVLGISLQNCPLQALGYNVLVGGDTQSWGWELKTNQLWHAGQNLGIYPARKKRCNTEHGEGFRPQSSSSSSIKTAQTPLPIPQRILLVLDADAGTLGFIVDDSVLGVAFKNLPRGVELFPAVSSVRGGASIRLRYLNGASCECQVFKHICFHLSVNIQINGVGFLSFLLRWPSFSDGSLWTVNSMLFRAKEEQSNEQTAFTPTSPSLSPFWSMMYTRPCVPLLRNILFKTYVNQELPG